MCGIAGVFDPRVQTRGDELRTVAARMAGALRHRGPDADGVWVDETCGVALSHRRLSIIDLSPTGAQPMISPSGRYVVTYNGEIYNYRRLADELRQRGVTFRGASDTEVLAAGLDEWGLAETLRRVDGMFAFAAWDQHEHRLLLARDRFGEKPLYWGWSDGRLLFGSELRALGQVASGLEVDRAAVVDLLAYKAVQAPRTIYCRFSKLLPGHYAVFTPDGEPSLTCYWSADAVALDALDRPLDIAEDEAAEELGARLRDIVASRMVADVPLGAFLSGGVDSAGIVAFMARVASRPVRTYTVGLDDPRFDESSPAAAVAARLGTEHRPLTVSSAEALELIPRIAEVYDEPFADSSQLPTYLVSRFAVDEVKVALTGDGGDEVFSGYNRHVHGDRVLAAHRRMPAAMRRAAARRLLATRPDTFDRWFGRVAPALPERLRVRLPADKAHKLGRLMLADAPASVYEALITDVTPGRLLRDGVEPRSAPARWHGGRVPFGQAAAIADTLGYLPDDILVKVDRAAMSVSLETRAPYLQPGLFEWSWRLPPHLRVSGGLGKRVLRDVVSRELDGLDVTQIKSGFGVPVGDWITGPLRPWSQDLLSSATCDKHGLIDAHAAQRLWNEHVEGWRDHTHVLWSLLTLHSWLSAEGVKRTYLRGNGP